MSRDGASIVEIAFKNTQTRLYNMASNIYTGYELLKDIMNPEGKIHRGRSRSRTARDRSREMRRSQIKHEMSVLIDER